MYHKNINYIPTKKETEFKIKNHIIEILTNIGATKGKEELLKLYHKNGYEN